MSKNTNLPPPAKAPPVLFKTRKIYSYWLKLYRKIAKPERFGIGERIDKLFLELLDLINSSQYSSGTDKILYLEKSIAQIDKIKFFSEIAWENKLMTPREYVELLEGLQNLGKELGGWKKSISIKTSRP